jgi:hypothetical protein
MPFETDRNVLEAPPIHLTALKCANIDTVEHPDLIAHLSLCLIAIHEEGNGTREKTGMWERKGGTYIQSFDALIKTGLDTLSHQAAATATAKVVLHALLSKSVFLPCC